MKNTPKKSVTANKETLDKLRSMPYSEYLKTKHWKSFRLKALKHHGKVCMMCGIKEVPYFHVHHLTYERLGCEEFKDVVVLCEECHNEVHRAKFVIKPQIKKAVKNRFIANRDRRRKPGKRNRTDTEVAEILEWYKNSVNKTAAPQRKKKKPKKKTILPPEGKANRTGVIRYF